MISVTLPSAQGRTDFSTWDRETLERFARQAADENRQLREDLRVALDAFRRIAALSKVTP